MSANLLQLRERFLAIAGVRTRPAELAITTGTGIDNAVHTLNATGLHSKLKIAVRRVYKTQLTTEKLKLDGDPSMQHFIHSTYMFADYDENDFLLMGKTIPAPLMNDTDKVWNTFDYAAMEDQLDLFFSKLGPLNAIKMLNQTISDVCFKYKDCPVAYDINEYNNRTRIGVWLEVPVATTEVMNRIETEFLKDYLERNGWGLLVVHAENLRNDQFAGRTDLNAFINSNFDLLDNKEKYPNGIVAVHPAWGYAARSMTESRLDVAINLRNSVNPQDDDRVMSGGKTLDGKKKLIGLKLNAGFRRQTADWSYKQTECLRSLFNDQCNEDKTTQALGPWLQGVNIFQRISGAIPRLMHEEQLKSELSDSDKIFRDMTSKVDLTSEFWISNLEILKKLNILKGKSKTEKLITNIKKRVAGAPRSKVEKKEAEDIRVFYVQILTLLVSFACFRLKGYAANRNFTSVVNTLQSITNDEILSAQVQKTLGISAEEYIMLLTDKDSCLPVTDMDYLFNAEISEMLNES